MRYGSNTFRKKFTMEIFKDALTSYPQCPSRFLGFERYSELAGDFILVVGSAYDPNVLYKLPKKKVLIEFDEPNRYYYPPELMRHDDYENAFDKIFTICPYSAEWQNKRQNNHKRTFVCFPFNEKLIPAPEEKIFDVIYTGHFLARTISDIVNDIQPYNYVVVSNSNDPRVTHRSASYEEKMKLIAQSKITIVHNLHFMDSYHVANLQTIPNYFNNQAFAQVPRVNSNIPLSIRRIITTAQRLFRKLTKTYEETEILVPHIKSRTFEAAFSRSLMLVQKDPFNVIGKFFEPNTEFVYYEPGELKQKLAEVLKNYQDYKPIIDRAYQRAIENYTSDAFFNAHLKDLKV